MELHGFGAAHNDPQAYERTMRGLERIKPNVISLEWEGPEYEAFLLDPEIKTLRTQMEDAIREVFRECDLNPALYDQANAKSIWGGEVKAAQDFAKQHGLPIIPTESAENRISMDLESLRNPEIGRKMFRDFLTGLQSQGLTYDPDQITAFDPESYSDFERHLAGEIDSEEMTDIVQSSMWAFKPERVQYQVEQLREAVVMTPKNGRLVHIGGFLHLLDDGCAPALGPVNLWQNAMMNVQGKMFRHSLSKI